MIVWVGLINPIGPWCHINGRDNNAVNQVNLGTSFSLIHPILILYITILLEL